MRLDTKHMRYLTAEDWRVLTAVEMGSKNHEVVPTPLIGQISGLRGGSGVHKSISNLAKVGLIARLKNAKYDGYRLTYGGLDYLSLHTYQKRHEVYSVGNQIGMGKESDIFVVADENGVQRVLKIHRLGRISFRTVKANRDYLRNRSGGSWMYMSRLAAVKEHAFMAALGQNGFPVPEPLAQSRHTIVMTLIDAFPLRQISSVPDPASLYAELISMVLRLAQYGLIHGDFNEFNILIKEEPIPKSSESSSPTTNSDQEKSSSNSSKTETPQIRLTPILIDFPQMVSIDHPNAEYYFDRDINCVKRFFHRRFHFTSNETGPSFSEARKLVGRDGSKRLDVEVEASGFSRKMAKELETYMKSVGVDGDGQPGEKRGDEDELEGDMEDDNEEESEDVGEEDEEEPQHELQVPDDADLDPNAPKDRFGNTIVALSNVSLEDKT